jgi:hypothetical protein
VKATVTLKEGFRYHRLDNTFVDLKQNDVVETNDIPPFEREERLRDGHLKPIPANAPSPPSANAPSPAPPAANAPEAKKK